eukprot:352603-Chlamydomonas_euryale.AAC.3
MRDFVWALGQQRCVEQRMGEPRHRQSMFVWGGRQKAWGEAECVCAGRQACGGSPPAQHAGASGAADAGVPAPHRPHTHTRTHTYIDAPAPHTPTPYLGSPAQHGGAHGAADAGVPAPHRPHTHTHTPVPPPPTHTLPAPARPRSMLALPEQLTLVRQLAGALVRPSDVSWLGAALRSVALSRGDARAGGLTFEELAEALGVLAGYQLAEGDAAGYPGVEMPGGGGYVVGGYDGRVAGPYGGAAYAAGAVPHYVGPSGGSGGGGAFGGPGAYGPGPYAHAPPGGLGWAPRFA